MSIVARNQYKKAKILFLFVFFLFGCGAVNQQAGESFIDNPKNQNPPSWPRLGSGIEVFYSWGKESRNRIDTISGTLTKDLISEGTITVPFELSEEQKMEIVAYADSIKIWYWPDALFSKPLDGIVSLSTPCNKKVLQLKRPSLSKTVVWDNCRKNANNPSPLREIIDPLGRLIEEMVLKSETYKKLPAAKGSYY